VFVIFHVSILFRASLGTGNDSEKRTFVSSLVCGVGPMKNYFAPPTSSQEQEKKLKNKEQKDQ
jgi:hypothetical protein